MVTPPIYRRSPPALVSYSASEVLTGVAPQQFYCAVITKMSGATAVSGAILVDNTISSQYTQEYSQLTGSYTSVKRAEYDFDSAPLNKTIILDGKAHFEMPYMMISGTGNGAGVYFVGYVSKLSGGSETILVSGQTVRISGAASTTKEGYAVLELTVPRTQFFRAEQIRATIEWWTDSEATAGQNIEQGWGHDPANSDPLNKFASTTTLVRLPFVADIL